jgi:hypothetical protein
MEGVRMTGRWWVGVAAGVALGLGAVVATEVATGDASAQGRVVVSAEQLRINQRISQAAVKRVNQAQRDIAALGAAAPLYAVSSGSVGSNLLRGRNAVSSQFVGDGNYRVKFTRNISTCSWSGTIASDAPPVPDALSIRIALDTTDVTRSQLVVRTFAAAAPVNSGFHVQVFC